MRVKSFFTLSMADAITQARKELGVDAVLLNSRKITDTNDQVRYEVVFGVDDLVPPVVALRQPTAAVAKVAPPVETAPTPAAASPRTGTFPSELDAIRKQIEDLRTAFASAPPTPPPPPVPPRARTADPVSLAPWRERLTGEDCHPRVVSEIITAVHDRLRGETRAGAPAPQRIDQLVLEEIQRRLPPPTRIGANTLVLVGPPGAGKTTTLVKLAVQQGLAAGRSVHIVSADPHRAVTGDMLRGYASILGVTFDHVDTFGGFMAAMDRGRQKSLVLVDTPGYSTAETDLARELAGFFECFEDIECQLVLPASMKTTDAARCAGQYAVFNPAALLFTRLDETTTYGGVASLSTLLRLPVSFLGNGQSIPDDLQPATAAGLAERICGPAPCVESVA